MRTSGTGTAGGRLAGKGGGVLPVWWDDAADGPTNTEFRVVWPDGTVRWLASRSTPVRDENGRTHARIGINWDITPNKMMATITTLEPIADAFVVGSSYYGIIGTNTLGY